MKKIGQWSKPVALCALVLASVGELSASAVASTTATTISQQSESTSLQNRGNSQLAQASVVGQCRTTKRGIFVYTERSATSQSIRSLAPGEQVTLADNGSNGWIAISTPVAGYVQASELKSCQTPTPPQPQPQPSPQPRPQPQPQGSNICRNVIYPPEGLAIRRNPVLSDQRIGGVYVGNTVRLASPRRTEKDSQGRTWIYITQPTAGWISSGFPEGNLGPEFSCR